jgi:hypothetical protein
MTEREFFAELLKRGEGVLRLAPAWVARPFNRPGGRLRLHPDDLFALGMKRGPIMERWFASVTHAATEGNREYEGMSFINVDVDPAHTVLFAKAVEARGEDLIGAALMEEYGTWPMYAKFYDFNEPLFHHVHHGEEACARVGVKPKHEHYYFPKQYNNHLGIRPTTFFGFDPSVTKEEVKARLARFGDADTRILELSRAFQIELGTGWYTPAGVVHAPGSLCTYEPQWNSDVMAVWQNVVGTGQIFESEWLGAYLPPGRERDVDAIFEVADWELNTLSDYRERYFRPPLRDEEGDGYAQNWICYGNDYIGAKELTLEPGAGAVVKDAAAYGCIAIQGRGTFGAFDCESPTLIRFGQLTADEFFVSNARAREGVAVRNLSRYEPLVILKHFGPDCGMPGMGQSAAGR